MSQYYRLIFSRIPIRSNRAKCGDGCSINCRKQSSLLMGTDTGYRNQTWTVPYVRSKVKLSQCFSWLGTTPWRRIGEVELYLHSLFDLGTRWRWVVSFTPRPLYPQGKSPWYPLYRRLGGPQSRSGHDGKEKNSQPPPGIDPRTPIVQPTAGN
jgi:hypothetical protein